MNILEDLIKYLEEDFEREFFLSNIHSRRKIIDSIINDIKELEKEKPDTINPNGE